MLAETGVAAYLLIWLTLFFSVNLRSILKFRRRASDAKTSGEIERPFSLAVALVALGTFVYFAAVLLFSFAVLAGQESVVIVLSLGYEQSFMIYVQVLGLGLTALGYVVFMWSVIARGKYAVSWDMPENQKLVTWGPYRYVRHPSYLGYFLMFIGFFCLWPNLFTLFPWIAIPGYYRVTFDEEKLLTQRFGKEYVEYQEKTRRLIPRFR
jgi:protein-S-isoprenylcysteine O-methyltransferase Ste14